MPADSAGRPEKAKSRNAGVHKAEESDRGVVPMNQPNKGAEATKEAGEGRQRTKENIVKSSTPPHRTGAVCPRD